MKHSLLAGGWLHTKDITQGWTDPVVVVYTCPSCRSILDYIYHTLWKCRNCNRWVQRRKP